MSGVIPLTTFADYIGRQVTIELDDGTKRVGQIDGIASNTVIMWPGSIHDEIPQRRIVKLKNITGKVVAERNSHDRIVALVSRQGTACPETALRGDEDTPENRAAVEGAILNTRYSELDEPLPGSWTDVTDNDYFAEWPPSISRILSKALARRIEGRDS